MRETKDEIQISTQSEVNRNLAKRWFREVWNERRAETIDELFPPGGIGHMEGGDQDLAGFKEVRAALLNAFPDICVEVEDTLADGEQVAVRWRVTGTHRGDGLGPPATNRPVAFRGISWIVFKNGVIVEAWDSWNLGRLLESLR
jgi:steroid delta-isomerase-like uncharacterized protein